MTLSRRTQTLHRYLSIKRSSRGLPQVRPYCSAKTPEQSKDQAKHNGNTTDVHIPTDLFTLDPRFVSALKKEFPAAISLDTFLDEASLQLNTHGFKRGNSICAVSTCRDENCRPLIDGMENRWGAGFSLTAMSSMLFPGNTAFQAFLSHAPNEGDREKFVIVAMTHIGISCDGDLGLATRPNRKDKTTSCGALSALHKQLVEGKVTLDFNIYDMEFSVLKTHLLGTKVPYGYIPNIKELTMLAQELVEEDLEKIISKQIDTSTRDYAVVTGVLINGPNMTSWVLPSKMYTVTEGDKREFSLSDEHAIGKD